MMNFLNAFGCGLAFAFGLVIGIAVSLMAVSKSRQEIINHNKEILGKLAENVECQKKIASCMEVIADNKRK